MSSPLVSVVILNYNGKALTSECIRSVLKSTYKLYEIVVVDNGSTDGSYAFLKKNFGSIKNIRIIRSDKNLFFTGGFNLGAKKSKGDWIILLSNDIVIDKNCIKELLICSENNSRNLIQPKILRYDNKKVIDNVGGRFDIFSFGTGIGGGEKDKGQYDYSVELDYVSATTFMISRRFFLSLGGYDQWYYSHYEDVDISLKAKKKGGRCLLCYKSKLYHRGSVTYKKYVDNPTLLYHIRKNRLYVVLSNFSGIEKWLRVSIILTTNLFFIISDLLSFDQKRMFITLRATISALVRKTKERAKNRLLVF